MATMLGGQLCLLPPRVPRREHSNNSNRDSKDETDTEDVSVMRRCACMGRRERGTVIEQLVWSFVSVRR
jgi:hypothetical protein